MKCPTCGTPVEEPVGFEEIDGCDARALPGARVAALCLVGALAVLAVALLWWAVTR